MILPCPSGQHFNNLQQKCTADSSSAESVQKPGFDTSGLTGVPASGGADKITTPNPAAKCLIGQHLTLSGCVNDTESVLKPGFDTSRLTIGMGGNDSAKVEDEAKCQIGWHFVVSQHKCEPDSFSQPLYQPGNPW